MFESYALLVEKARDGDTAAQERLYTIISRLVRAQLFRNSGRYSDEEVHEATTAAMMAIWRGEIRQPRALPAYLRTLSSRLAGRAFRKQVSDAIAHVEVDRIPIESEAETPEQRLIRSDLLRSVLSQIEKLNPNEKEALRRFYLLSQSEEEASAAMGLTVKRFQLLKARARKKLQVRLSRSAGAGSDG